MTNDYHFFVSVKLSHPFCEQIKAALIFLAIGFSPIADVSSSQLPNSSSHVFAIPIPL